MKFLVDSVIVIDHFNDIENATRFLSEQGSAGLVIPEAGIKTGESRKRYPRKTKR